MGYFGWKPYVPVAERRRRAERTLAKLAKKGQVLAPIKIEGRQITRTFWGNAWCNNLENYSDYENRLPRGRTYVRNGSVLDLQISPGRITAFVSGTALYEIVVQIKSLPATRWKAICRDCSGSIDSLVELLQGRLSQGVMNRVCQPGTGLFPSPEEIKIKCSCPDWADLCKHVAAVLYGVGSRLDTQPELLFQLREVDVNALIDEAGRDVQLGQGDQVADSLKQEDLGALFGLDMAEALPDALATKPTRVGPAHPTSSSSKPRQPSKKTAARLTKRKVTTTKLHTLSTSKKTKTRSKKVTKKTAKATTPTSARKAKTSTATVRRKTTTG